MNIAHRKIAQGALFVAGAVAALGCWMVLAIDLMMVAASGVELEGGSTLIWAGGVASAILATASFVVGAKKNDASLVLLFAPVALLVWSIGALTVFLA